MFAWFVDHLFVTFYNKISGCSMGQWAGKIGEFRAAIHARMRSSPIQIERRLEGGGTDADIIDIDLDSFRLFGFLDDTCVYTQRPGAGPVGGGDHAPRREEAHDEQRAFYSGYMKKHGLKFQHLLLPNGLYGSVWGSSLAHNDTGILNMSGLVDYLQDVLEWIPGTNLYPALYADGIFPRTPVVVGRDMDEDDRQIRIDRRCNSLRQSIKLMYG